MPKYKIYNSHKLHENVFSKNLIKWYVIEYIVHGSKNVLL